MPTIVPPLPFFCINVLARFPDQLHHFHQRRVPASPALLDAFPNTRDPCLWATLAQLVHPLPPHLHELDLPLSHPTLPILQKIPDTPDFSFVTLVSLPNCIHLRDDNIADLHTLHRLLALDLRGCSISSYALTALARGLAASSNDDSARTGTWGLRLLCLHGCPNIDNDALSVLHKFPLLSAVDLRFTRCTPTAVNACLSSLDFRPSDNNSLFYPAPLSLALCALEKVALTASDPISLYSCPPQSVFRVHVNELNHLPSHTKKVVSVDRSSISHATIRTISSAEDTVTFIPPLQKPAKNEFFPSGPKPFVPVTAVSLVSTSFPTDRPTYPNIVSNVSSFYENAPPRSKHPRRNILPLSAQAVQSSEGGKLDPLAIARSPPPWKILDTYKSPSPSNPPVAVASSKGASSDSVENPRRRQPIARWTGHALNSPLEIDRTRLHRRGSDAVADMVHQFANKRLRVESEFALAKTRANVSAESRNPFARSARSVFAESSTNTSGKPRPSVHESSKEAKPDMQLRATDTPKGAVTILASACFETQNRFETDTIGVYSTKEGRRTKLKAKLENDHLTMDYFSKFLKTNSQPSPKPVHDHAGEFNRSWNLIKTTLEHPDERQLMRGIESTNVPAHLQSMVDSLVWESSRTEEGGTGACLEYLLKNDVLGTLVRLSEPDRPSGIQAEVLRTVQNMVVLMDEQFLVHSAVHRAVLRLLRNCVGDDLQEQLDGRNRVMGAAKNAVRSQPSEYELDLVNLLCILCSRIRTHRELLMIFFHDKHWYRSEPLFAVEEEEEGEEDEDEEGYLEKPDDGSRRVPSPAPSQATITSAARKPEYEFLLFNYLLRFVHREGQIGDFARAGLLFLMDVAMSPGGPAHRRGETGSEQMVEDPITDAALALAEYIVDGDFSDVLDTSPAGMVLGSTGPATEKEKEDAEAQAEKNRAIGLEESTNSDFKARIDHFLKILEFLQDIIRRNIIRNSADNRLDAPGLVGASIVQSILDAVRRIFLENVLYPSILECSDLDGSAVAVMSYIDIMIRTLENGQLSDLFVDFLMSEDSDDISKPRHRLHGMLNLSGNLPPRSRSSSVADKAANLHRRKSSAMVLLEMEAPESRRQSEYFTTMARFTLKDLILSNLRLRNQATVTAALQLFQTMLTQRCHTCVDGLILVIPSTSATNYPEPAMVIPFVPPKTSGEDSDDEEFVYPGAEKRHFLPTNARWAFTLLSYHASIHRTTTDAFSTGYDHYLRDALTSIQSHSCFHISADENLESRSKQRHRLNVKDPILSLILDSLCKFFSNSPKMNISLTGVLAELALCPNRSIAGWLTCNASDAPQPKAMSNDVRLEDMQDDRSIDFEIDEKLVSETNILPATRLDENSRPIVHTIFQGLVGQLERYRQLVDNFDKYLLERRRGLLFSENLTDALTLVLEPAVDSGLLNTPSTSVSSSNPSDMSMQRPKSKPKTSSSLVSFLTPRKNKSKAQTPAEPQTPSRDGSKVVASRPFAPHYQQTRDIIVEPFVVPPPFGSSSLWTPSKTSGWGSDEEDVFSAGSQWGGVNVKNVEESDDHTDQHSFTHITLSHLLDNVVVLEECIKELVAIVQARRSLGIDSLRYV
ncbi:Retinoic acid induced 16-like protein-domain-containing protein [Lanmaoa asiatica]|nr:Retinoic acid induced 16-like protein-domain-containing protein [Lanmaoa asiatica]